MAIGRTFQESLQKAMRGLEIGRTGFDSITDLTATDAKATIRHELQNPGADRPVVCS